MINLPESETTFLCDLVKVARQKPQHVKWIDRDGTERVSALSIEDAAHVNKLAHQLGISKAEVLRQAAHIPVKRVSEKAPAAAKDASTDAAKDAAAE